MCWNKKYFDSQNYKKESTLQKTLQVSLHYLKIPQNVWILMLTLYENNHYNDVIPTLQSLLQGRS